MGKMQESVYGPGLGLSAIRMSPKEHGCPSTTLTQKEQKKSVGGKLLKMKHSANRNQKGNRFSGHLFPFGSEEVHVEAQPRAPLAMNYVVFREFSAPTMSLPLERELMDGN